MSIVRRQRGFKKVMMNREQLTVRGQGSKLQVGRSVGRGGFTLLEILVAMSIFSVSFLALAAAASSVMRANQTSYASTIATNLAQDKLEELMATTSANIVSGGPVTDSIGGVTFERRWEVKDDSPVAGVMQIDVKVDWTDHIAHSLTVTSAVYQ